MIGLALLLTACSSGFNSGPLIGCTAGSSVGSTTAPVNGAVAGRLSQVAAEMSVGEFRLLNTNGYNASLLDACDGSHTVLEWADRGYWDPLRNQFHFVGQGHYACEKHLVYTESTNSWSTAVSPSFGGIGHGYEHNAMDPATGNLFYRAYNSKSIRKFFSSCGKWTDLPKIPTRNVQVAGAAEYFPELHGLVFVDSSAGVWLYREPTNSWSRLASAGTTKAIGAYHNFSAYHPGQKMVLFGGGNGSTAVFKVDDKGTVSQVARSPAELGIKRGIVLPNSVTGNFMAFYDNGQLYEYRVASNSWANVGNHPIMNYTKHWRVGAVVESRGVFMFITSDLNNSKVLLYKYGISDTGQN